LVSLYSTIRRVINKVERKYPVFKNRIPKKRKEKKLKVIKCRMKEFTNMIESQKH